MRLLPPAPAAFFGTFAAFFPPVADGVFAIVRLLFGECLNCVDGCRMLPRLHNEGRAQKQKKSFNLFEQNLKNEKTENFKLAKTDLK